jgi:hypothetical protein
LKFQNYSDGNRPKGPLRKLEEDEGGGISIEINEYAKNI